ncbi:hypothetical protein P4C99_10175 [Pontiellaceae bacterium B1224]|nr:hypothetical protein [Pontiellaceae bacterium B1224]
MNPLKKKQYRLMGIGGATALLLVLLPVLFPMSGKPGPNGVAALGRFHILTLHFPIALVMLVPLLELLTRTRRLNNLKVAVYPLLVLATLSSIVASVLGFMLAQGDGFSGALVSDHMRAGIVTSILLIITLLLKELTRHNSGMAFQAAYIITLSFSVLSLISTSHHGASLVHGTDYLYEKLPPGLQPLFSAGNPAQQEITKESNVYDRLIQPIFRTHCYECHSKDKSKGGFRMDDFELLLSGGDGGMPGIEPGNLEDSEVHYRITLPPTKKAFMPPAGHQPLTEEQVALITWWIQSGASAEASVADLLQSYPSDPERGPTIRIPVQ